MNKIIAFLLLATAAFAEDKELSKDEQIAILKGKTAVQAEGIEDLTSFLRYYQNKTTPAVAAMNNTIKEIETKHNCKIMDDLTCKPNEEKKPEEIKK